MHIKGHTSTVHVPISPPNCPTLMVINSSITKKRVKSFWSLFLISCYIDGNGYILYLIFVDSLVPKSNLPQLSDLYLLDAIIAKIQVLMDEGVSKPATESADSTK